MANGPSRVGGTAADKNAGWSMLVPWVDVALLSAATVFFAFATARSPGQTADLPSGPFADGVRTRHTFVVRASPRRGGGHPPHPVAFFRDGRYPLGTAQGDSAFRRVAASAISGEPLESRVALAYADGDLPHRDAMRFCSLLREAGFSRVCFAVRPDDAPSAEVVQ